VINSERLIASNVTGYSIPAGAKKPLFQWTPTTAVSIVQKIKKAPTRVSNPIKINIPPRNSAKAAAVSHNQAGRMNGKGVWALVKAFKPGPPKVPNTFPAPWAIKTAPIASLSGNGPHDADVEIILLNITRILSRSEPERAHRY
jgi:hypothetical protein